MLVRSAGLWCLAAWLVTCTSALAQTPNQPPPQTDPASVSATPPQVALLLAVVGIYGVMSHSVTQRTNEIGIRVAFGASARNVLASVLGRGLIVIGIGTAIGLVASLSLTRIIASSLWGVTPTDPATYTVVLVTLLVVACLACYVPARRALKVDPLVAMRRD
jgi:ABC-type antimicrobial peptide transport system permease subunit